jgi:hypothetical protein
MNINDKRYRNPKLISEYLPLVKQISHIYQRPSGEVEIIDENKYYFLHIVMKMALFYTQNRNESSTFYTKNRSESSAVLHHFIPSPWR